MVNEIILVLTLAFHVVLIAGAVSIAFDVLDEILQATNIIFAGLVGVFALAAFFMYLKHFPALIAATYFFLSDLTGA